MNTVQKKNFRLHPNILDTVSEEIADAWNQIAEILIQKFAKIEG